MATSVKSHTYLLFNVIQYLVFCFQAHAVRYDSTYKLGCWRKPLTALYGGGILVNPELNEGLKGWKPFGGANIQHVTSSDGNNFIVADNRTRKSHSFSQRIHLTAETHYSFSAWLQVNRGKADVAAIIKTKTAKVILGLTTARKGCWSMLKGGMVAKTSGPARLYFVHAKPFDIWADSISLQPFSSQEWKAHQKSSIDKVRKTNVRLQVLDAAGRPIPNAAVSVQQRRAHFRFGCAMNKNILENDGYRTWFSSKFNKTYTVFENELKWPEIEPNRGEENYTTADAMVEFAQGIEMKIRGHNIFWDKEEVQSKWVRELSPDELRDATSRRIQSVMNRYRENKFIQWDVVNENMHTNYFESRLNDLNASGKFYKTAHEIDSFPTPFLNEYNTIECPGCCNVWPQKYLDKIDEIRAQGYKGKLGIGLQGHFQVPDSVYIRASLDILKAYRLPIWITELDVESESNQAQYLDQALQELYSHRAVKGIMLWSAWSKDGCYKMCLTDNYFRNLPTGDVVDKFMRRLRHHNDVDLRGRTTDSNGFFEASLFHGVYDVELRRANGSGNMVQRKIYVRPNKNRLHRFTIRD